MTDNIIKICVNLSNLCHLCAIKHNAKLSFNFYEKVYLCIIGSILLHEPFRAKETAAGLAVQSGRD